MSKTLVRKLVGTVAAVTLTAALGACSGNTGGGISDQWNESADKGFVAGDGSSVSIIPAERSNPVEFSGTDPHGEPVESADFTGSVTVVNFWYAGCAPCRAEAADLVGAYEKYSPDGVKFLGVNTRDQAAQALQFEKEFGIPFPSVIDMQGDRGVQRAFAGEVPLNAVPTTLVLDTQGRIAHRVLGQLSSQSQLETLIKETLSE